MFYDNRNISFEITNVFHVRRDAAESMNRNRAWSGIAYRISGSSVFRSGGKKYVADEGSISYVPAWVDFERSSTEEELIIVHLHVYGENEKEIQIFFPENTAKFSTYFFEMAKVWEECAVGYRHRCSSIFYKLLEEMERYTILNSPNKKEHIIRNSLMYMHMNFDNPDLSIADIAKESNISQVYFRKLYKEIFGISPLRAVNQLRIQKAKDMLKSGYFTISEIAEKCGFENTKYFSTLFKKEVEKTPSEYMTEHDVFQ